MRRFPEDTPQPEQGATSIPANQCVTIEGNEDLTRKPRKVSHLYPQYFSPPASSPGPEKDDEKPVT
jgi:hypothetical protein